MCDDRGMAWQDSWISIAMVSRDHRDQARERWRRPSTHTWRVRRQGRVPIEEAKLAEAAGAHERAQQQWAARSCETGGVSERGLSPTGLCDGFHPIGRWVNDASYHAWVPILASRLLPVGVVYLLRRLPYQSVAFAQ